MMKWQNSFRMLGLFGLLAFLLAACSSQAGPAGAFDPENQQEYGVSGVYLGQNIKEAMDLLKPTKADFMDMISRESYTVERMAKGEGEAVMGMLLIDRTQLLVKVRKGELISIMLGGVAKEDAARFQTLRGLSMYDSKEQLKKLYGEGSGETEVVYEGSKYTANFGVSGDQVVWFRFDSK